jgi:hypothetical protein
MSFTFCLDTKSNKKIKKSQTRYAQTVGFRKELTDYFANTFSFKFIMFTIYLRTSRNGKEFHQEKTT